MSRTPAEVLTRAVQTPSQYATLLHHHLSSYLLNMALLFVTFMVYLSPLDYKLHEIHETFDLFTVVSQSPRPLPGTQ